MSSSKNSYFRALMFMLTLEPKSWREQKDHEGLCPKILYKNSLGLQVLLLLLGSSARVWGWSKHLLSGTSHVFRMDYLGTLGELFFIPETALTATWDVCQILSTLSSWPAENPDGSVFGAKTWIFNVKQVVILRHDGFSKASDDKMIERFDHGFWCCRRFPSSATFLHKPWASGKCPCESKHQPATKALLNDKSYPRYSANCRQNFQGKCNPTSNGHTPIQTATCQSHMKSPKPINKCIQ